MGIMDFIKGELIDIIEWTDDSRDTLSYRFPDDDKAIKNGAQLIVRESQQAQFVYVGEFGDTFGPIGGHNFAWAWATGRLAGRGAAAQVAGTMGR